MALRKTMPIEELRRLNQASQQAAQKPPQTPPTQQPSKG